MDNDVSTAATIESLRQQLDAARAEIAGFKYMMQRGQDWMNSAHDSWQTMLRKRDGVLEELKKALADNATLNTAKDQLIDERNACLKELDAARKDNDFLRAFANNPDVQKLRDDLETARAESDRIRAALQREYDHSKNLETSLAASKSREEAYRADVVRLTTEREEWRKINENQSILVMLTEAELTRERSRADVLAAEVRDARAWHDTDARSTGQMMELSSNWDKSRAETDRTHALDPAKFEGKP